MGEKRTDERVVGWIDRLERANWSDHPSTSDAPNGRANAMNVRRIKTDLAKREMTLRVGGGWAGYKWGVVLK